MKKTILNIKYTKKGQIYRVDHETAALNETQNLNFIKLSTYLKADSVYKKTEPSRKVDS